MWYSFGFRDISPPVMNQSNERPLVLYKRTRKNDKGKMVMLTANKEGTGQQSSQGQLRDN